MVYRDGALVSPAGQVSRFILRDEPFMRDAYGLLRTRLMEIMDENPAVVGATAFGSSTKGYAVAGQSDLDMSLFINADRLGLELDTEGHDLGDINVLGDWSVFQPVDARKGKPVAEIADQLRSSDSELEISPQVLPISHKYLKFLAAETVKQAETDAEYYRLRAEHPEDPIESLADWATISTDTEVLARVPGLAKLMDAAEVSTRFIDMMSVRYFLGRQTVSGIPELNRSRAEVFWNNRFNSAVALSLFNLTLTDGLQPYRRTFLEGLREASEPDKAWRYFAKCLAKQEDSEKHPRDISKIHYPETLGEAIEAYGISANVTLP